VPVYPTPSDLDNTVAARWRARLIGVRPDDEKSHWRTKTAYYAAVGQLCVADPGRPMTWQTIVAAVRPRGSRSTFYDVAGPHAKHPLTGDLLAADTPDANQLALCYQRPNAVEQLIDEAKVWSYWPYREGWLDQYRRAPELTGATAAATLVAVVAEWARRNPRLAASLDHAPPMCAVEDLVLVSRGQLSARRAYLSLQEALPRAATAPSVADTLFDPAPLEIGLSGPPLSTPDALLDRLAEQLYAMNREAQRLAAQDAVGVRELAATLMRDAVSLLAA